MESLISDRISGSVQHVKHLLEPQNGTTIQVNKAVILKNGNPYSFSIWINSNLSFLIRQWHKKSGEEVGAGHINSYWCYREEDSRLVGQRPREQLILISPDQVFTLRVKRSWVLTPRNISLFYIKISLEIYRNDHKRMKWKFWLSILKDSCLLPPYFHHWIHFYPVIQL